MLGADRALRAGRWHNAAVAPRTPFGTTLTGRRAGIIGFGETGTEVARLCQAAGLRVRAVRCDPTAPVPTGPRPDGVGGNDRMPGLLAESDVVVVMVPLGPATRGLVGPAELAELIAEGRGVLGGAAGPTASPARRKPGFPDERSRGPEERTATR
ncbi:NAD(P)-dependent oxidoreductase [Streptomyces sp. WG7]|uniref:NAD(P)-dependent oxidoreductase n=1 Tax=Streptomyces sp. WG7 TaxID=3417650 RepID=UPI003CE7ECAA